MLKSPSTIHDPGSDPRYSMSCVRMTMFCLVRPVPVTRYRETTCSGTAKPTLRRTDSTRCAGSNSSSRTSGSLLAANLLRTLTPPLDCRGPSPVESALRAHM
eukprot:8430251-Pyramimonas_sp.AAC.1